MDGIFSGILSTMDEMMNPAYELRRIGRHEDSETKLFVSTVKSHDLPGYETAVAHPDYNNGKIVIVEEYETKQQAKEGHERWLAKMTSPELPEYLQDVSSSFGEFRDHTVYKRGEKNG